MLEPDLFTGGGAYCRRTTYVVEKNGNKYRVRTVKTSCRSVSEEEAKELLKKWNDPENDKVLPSAKKGVEEVHPDEVLSRLREMVKKMNRVAERQGDGKFNFTVF